MVEVVLLFRDRHALDGVTLANGIDDIHAFLISNLTEYRVTAVEMGLGAVCDEELAAVRIWTGVGHRNNTCFMLQWIVQDLIFEAIPRTAAPGTGWIAALDHEIADHSVKSYVVIKTLIGQKNEVIHCLWRICGI